jgi:N,N'-diacetyllegionaminate synthase
MRGPVVFLIPARGGSRRIPGKNLRRVAGIPLVGHAIRIARRTAALVDANASIVCSTDDAEIARVARDWGAEIVDRPANLASDDATSVDVAIHALEALEGAGRRFHRLALLQPTSPLTSPTDVRAAIDRSEEDDVAVVSVTASHPARFHVHADGAGFLDGAPAAGVTDDQILSGGFYVIDPEVLRTARAFVVPRRTVAFAVPPARSVDVDDPADVDLAGALAVARPIRPLRIGGREIGAGGTFVIAEAGVNHDGDVGIAHRLVDAAADAGATAVKFQTFDPAALASAAAATADYQRAAGEGDGQREMLSRLALPIDAWPALQRHAADRGLVFLSTPFDDASAELLDRLDVPAFKVGSGELTNVPFLERLAARGRPLILSTGMADMCEVARAVDAIEAAGDPGVALLHCVSAYPADPADANLRAIGTMRAAFAVPTGWSDHTDSIEIPVAAVALGAAIIEKHLTLDRTRPGPDHRASLEPDAFTAMVAAMGTVERGLGSGEKQPTAAERPIAAVVRRSLHWGTDIAAGTVVAEGHVVALRPGTGISPAVLATVVGRRLVRPALAGLPVDPNDLEDAT